MFSERRDTHAAVKMGQGKGKDYVQQENRARDTRQS